MQPYFFQKLTEYEKELQSNEITRMPFFDRFDIHKTSQQPQIHFIFKNLRRI